ncbi:WecB/TagA/CpsF family glycosyltransferase [Sulfurovum sp. zt1-1]|uniref:WecB/TagA/CpsF family glycosyltransferase n=1 Tax=Sulfurovum zhangzhouensis TaxID=3019067 RepID=A0ABT7R0J4_9BACT|nr:WecB/TagA/CpsF family glycosyltransferase [Sulfurovum zhangzhouensis]MDM5272542.1 WecB/TagA/CpsF family glycosyltransferase [Sulfurovum zhangzhouensis]
MLKNMKIMGYDVFVDTLETIKVDTDKKMVVNTINPHSYVTAKSDSLFEEALRDSDLLLPDGSGIVLAASQVNKKQIKKIAGYDLHMHLIEELEKVGGSVFYMGASQKTVDAIHERVAKEYPNVRVGSYSPPFKPEFSQEDNETIISKVNAFNPDVLFIGMTAPKQEKWLHAHKKKLNYKIASSIGAVFDFYAGTVNRPSQFWIDMHLEWLPRLLKEPKRLWKRNFVSTPLFLWDMLLYKLGIMGK